MKLLKLPPCGNTPADSSFSRKREQITLHTLIPFQPAMRDWHLSGESTVSNWSKLVAREPQLPASLHCMAGDNGLS